MAETVTVVRDEDTYWRLGKEFVRALIVEVNDALREAGVGKQAQRREICEIAAFGIGNFFDQYWLKVDGRTVYPVLCFTETYPDGETPLALLGPVQFPDKAVELHAMVPDEVAWYFKERNENDDAVAMGCVGEEDAEPDSSA